MTEHLQSEHDEDAFTQRLLQPLANDAATVEAELLAKLRAKSLSELVETQKQNPDPDTSDLTGVGSTSMKNQSDKATDSSQVTLQRIGSESRGRGMVTLAVRAAVSVTALVVSGFVWFFAGVNADADSTLGDVLDATREAHTLQLTVTRDGDEANVWLQDGGRLRYEASPSSYHIADGTTLWKIDEDANLAQRSDDSLLATAASNQDLLALLGVGKDGSSILRRARPVGTAQHDGVLCRLYRATASVGEQRLMFEAFVGKKDGRLRSIAAWPVGPKKRKGPPVAELRLVARNVQLKKSQFEWAKSLSEDGRIGKITDSQGIVVLRPKLHRRWTPICGQMRLKPGDQIRTDVRGANAVAARLTSGAKITVGPGTLVELTSANTLRVHYGVVQITGGSKGKVELRGPEKEVVRPKNNKATLYLVDRDQKFAILKKKPRWLLGFEGASTDESIGSLIVKVDGRDVPLTIGYHKVKVEIRDQIARTTIEESFVNRTDGRLEGIFHFPLPQDASISGFGMWIGGELVEADVVEKQRAREIYETILRERRDPGLLEWTGGNIFKARVFPIEAHSEKRIKIVYTQVLPLRANQYRYSYALRSEMLMKTPLRELSIDVLINSALPLKKIDSPTHPVRVEQSQQSASVQFSAQEYSPTRDFELVCELEGRTSDVVTIPHRRGDDGYFMLQLMPPSAEGNWRQEVLPDGDPLDVLLVCDTSGSMDKANRKTQAEFVAAVLASLSPDDRFNMAVCDAECKWLFKKSVASEGKNVDQARAWLNDRLSMGWTDLDATFESIQKRVGKKSHVIYIGDGVVSARDTNAQDFAVRVRRLYGKKAQGTFHAVSTGSSFESVVLQAIASIGRGSVRSIGSGQTPMSVALELLNEMAQPGLRDLNVEFRGMRVAAVYPKELPNLSAGTQQILIGRYLPTDDGKATLPVSNRGARDGKIHSAEIVVTGKRGEETVRYSAKIPLKDAEKGNSFVPRLWARAHLDHLLQQGGSQFIKDEIISLSEEFHIITPFTSLLVLESDADRKRFGVKRRFEMRDGERFFADGRDLANYELQQKAIREAGSWRLGLQRQVLRQLAALGRDPRSVQQMKMQAQQSSQYSFASRASNPMGGVFDVVHEGSGLNIGGESWAGGGFGGGSGGGLSGGGRLVGGMGGSAGFDVYGSDDLGRDLNGPVVTASPFSMPVEKSLAQARPDDNFTRGFGDGLEFKEGLFNREERWVDGRLDGRSRMGFATNGQGKSSRPFSTINLFQPVVPGRQSARQSWFTRSPMAVSRAQTRMGPANSSAWINTFFPTLPDAPKPAVDLPVKKSIWSKEALALSRSLLRNDWLKKFENGLEIRRSTRLQNPTWNRENGRSERLELYSRDAWLTWTDGGTAGRTIHWYNAKERGSISETFSLGRIRKSDPQDRKRSFAAGQFSFGRGWHEMYRDDSVQIIDVAAGQKQLLLTNTLAPKSKERITIDVKKSVVVKTESLIGDRVIETRINSDFIQIQGAWWPRKSEALDAQGRVSSTETTTYTSLGKKAFLKRHAEELSLRSKIQFLHQPVPSIQDAETAEADGTADFADRLALIVRSSRIQEWKEVFKQLVELEKVAGAKPGTRWIRLEILKSARRNAEALKLIRDQCLGIAQVDGDNSNASQSVNYARAQYLVGSAVSIANSNESLEVQDELKAVYARQPEYLGAKWTWRAHRIASLRSLNRTVELLALQKQQAEEQPWAIYMQTQYARDLANFGDHKAAYAWLKKTIGGDDNKYTQGERSQAWRTWADLLQVQGDSAAQIEIVEQWLDDKPESEQPYSRYLTSLSFDNQTDKAGEVALAWLKAGRIKGELSPADRARTAAAINFAMGSGWNMYHDVIILKWLPPIQQTALYFMGHDHHFEFCRQIMDRYQFSNSDAADVVRVRMFAELKKNAATMKQDLLHNYAGWVCGGKPDENADDWKPIATTLRKRWEGLKHTAEPDDEKHSIGNSLSSIYAISFRAAEYQPFLRERIKQANKTWRDQYVTDLFGVLMSELWSESIETELFVLLPELSKNKPSTQLAVQVEAAYRLVDQMLATRLQADQRDLADKGHPEKLTRQELAAKQAEFVQTAREGVAARLAAEAKKHQKEHGGLLGEWLAMERMFLNVRLDRNLDEAAAACMKLLGESPPLNDASRKAADAKLTAEEQAAQSTQAMTLATLRQRALVTLSSIALGESAKPKLFNWLLNYVDAGIANKETAAQWKQMKYDLLIAADKPQQLEQAVRKWIRTDEYVTEWRKLLARLIAERGEIEAAIDLFERIEKDSQLEPADYQALAGWYLAQDQKEEFKRAKIESLKAVQEYYLSNYVSQRQQRWSDASQPLPSELNEQVLFAFQALFEKSNNPGNYLYQLRRFYRACRDFRLLRMIPDSVVGRTPQQVYSFLSQLRVTVLVDMRKEATADEILKRIAELRQEEITTTDQRALDLLESIVERRSAEVLNQPGPHVKAAVAALKRAFEREWANGEGRQMAEFLNTLGYIKHPELASEQLRELELLHRREKPGTDDRLFTGWSLAGSRFSSYGKRDEGLQLLEAAIVEYEQSHPNGWPAQSNAPFRGYVSMLEQLNRHAVAEALVKKYLAKPLNRGQRNWMIEQLTGIYASALEAGSRVSMGANEELYKNLLLFVVKHAQQGDENHRYQVLQRLRDVFRSAKRKGFGTFSSDLRKFAFVTLPKFLKQQRNNYRSQVDLWSHVLNELLGPKIALEFLIERIENYPERFMHNWENPWQQFGYRVGEWRQAVGKNLGDLEPRLLALVLAELKRDLTTRNQHSRHLYRVHSYFWKEKEADFAKAAEEVLAKHRDSARYVRYIAEYFWDSLKHRKRAIEIMFVALKDELLDDYNQAKLVDWLHDSRVKRYAESISILEGLVKRHPTEMQYRCELITAYHQTKRTQQRTDLITQTIDLLRQDGGWNESNLKQLATCTHFNSLHGRTIHLVGELIPMHQRNQPSRGIGQGTLSGYYGWLANAHSHLGHTEKAIDAAAAAIVSWGPTHSQRTNSMQKLDAIINAAKDLDDYVNVLDKRAEETKQDSSVIRRSIGNAYLGHKQFDKAITQLKIAIDLQPGDLNAHTQLIEAFLATQDNTAAVRQRLELINIDRHNLAQYEALESQLRDDKEQAERAATSIIEASPNEAEYHAAFAKIRTRKKQHAEAARHWRQVAKLRSLEPNGLINLSKAQVQAEQIEAARATIKRLESTDWPNRFTTDVENAVKEFNRSQQ
jgi:hypothetical protein